MDTGVLDLILYCVKQQGFQDTRLLFNCLKALEYSLNYDQFFDQSEYAFEIKKYLAQLNLQEDIEKLFAHEVNQISDLSVSIIQDYFSEAKEGEVELANIIEQRRTLDGHLFDDTKFVI